MTLTKKLTRQIKESNCIACKLANKKALKEGEIHCRYNGGVSIKNGTCEQRRNGTGKRKVHK